MSEYIVKIDGQMPDAIFERELTEIVRCKDCRFCVKIGYRLYCDLNVGGFPEVESDGFCAWAERREQ